jgi:Predicted nucleotidyltransferase
MSRYFLVTRQNEYYNFYKLIVGKTIFRSVANEKQSALLFEYNPFHNGHLYHAKQSKNQSNADVVIAVMSGHFLQRGEPSLVDKWHRTKMALQNGIDLVIELPYVFSTGHATHFAEGAITLLNAIGCETFTFGSEEGTIEPFSIRII